MAAGTQQLTAVFSPTDSTDYASVTAHTSLSVTAPSAPVGGTGGTGTGGTGTGGTGGGTSGGSSGGTGLPTPAGCGGPTINLNSGMSQSTLQSTIASAPSCAMVVFAAGTYNITAPLTLNCGVTYTGPAAAPATAILNGASSSVSSSNGIFTLWSNQNLSNPCTQPTTIEYLNFSGATTGIFVQTSFTNLTIQYNQFTNIPGSQNQTTAMLFESGTTTSNTASELTNTTISHNQIGDVNSCVSPTNVMADTDSPEDYEGACNGIVFFTSINGLTVTYNNFFHVSKERTSIARIMRTRSMPASPRAEPSPRT